jgi:tocopherol O-methyltransferase
VPSLDYGRWRAAFLENFPGVRRTILGYGNTSGIPPSSGKAIRGILSDRRRLGVVTSHLGMSERRRGRLGVFSPGKLGVVMTADTVGLSTSDVASHYDDLDRFYREFWGEHVHHGLWKTPGETPEEATRNLVEAVAEKAGLHPGAAVCDIGCGYGATARLLVRSRQVRVTALTVSKAQYDYALASDIPTDNPSYLLRDWLANGLDTDSFDAAIAIESSEHMPDLSTFFAEACRVLRPGGKLVICAWLTREKPRAWEARWLLRPICREGRMRGMETVSEYDRIARASGLVPVDYEDVSTQVKKTWPICAFRVARGLIREPSHRRFLFREGGPNRVFALTLFRIWLAYELGSMRYGILTYTKPEN